jgi:hypothetical protein
MLRALRDLFQIKNMYLKGLVSSHANTTNPNRTMGQKRRQKVHGYPIENVVNQSNSCA